MDELDRHPAVRVAARLAAEVLEPAAADVDRATVPHSHIDAIKASGLLGLSIPVEYGGAGAPPAVSRRVAEILAGACCSTWFVQVQHHGGIRMLLDGDHPARSLLPQLADGTLLGGVAFSHLRSYPRRPVEATRVPGGWSLTGRAPWCTGWGLGDVLLVGGVTPDDDFVLGYVPARVQPELQASAPLQLAALQAASTVALTLDGLVVPDEMVAAHLSQADWARADRRLTNVNPGVVGITAAATSRLLDAGDADAVAAGGMLAEQALAARDRCYRLIDDVPPDEQIEERLAAKAAAVQVMLRATAALVTAGGGRSLALDQTPQRLAREALFLLVQAQTAPVRAAQLAALAAPR